MSSELIQHQPSGLIPVADQSVSLMAVISRAASDPKIDVSKMRELMAMHAEMQARQAKVAYATAMAELQPNIPVIEERGKVPGKFTYVLFEDLQAKIKPVLAQYGFSMTFRTRFDGGMVVVTGVLSHRDGHSETTEMPMPVDKSGSKNEVQAMGSSVSYGMRYCAKALLNLTSYGEDDDGRYGGGSSVITDDQAGHIRQLLDEGKINTANFLKWCGVPDGTIDDIPAAKYEPAVAMIKARIANQVRK